QRDAAALDDARKDRLMERLAMLYFQVGRLEDAERVATEIVKGLRRSAAGNYVLGAVQEARGDHAAALTRYLAAHEAKPEDARIAAALGRRHLEDGRYAQAIAVFNKARIRRRTDADLVLEIATAMERRGDGPQVRDYLEARLSEEFRGAPPEEVAKLMRRLDALRGRDEALPVTFEEARKAFEANRDDVRLRARLAALYLHERKDAASALDHAEAALHRGPQAAEAWSVKAAALDALGRTDAALEAARRARVLSTDDVTPHWIEARIQLARGQWNQAATAAERGLEIDAAHGPLRLILGEAEAGRGKPAEALRHADALQAGAADDPALHRLRGRALHALERFEDAIAALRTAQRGAPKDPVVRRLLGDALLRTGRDAEGASLLAEVAADATAPFGERRDAADALHRARRFDDAAAAFAAAAASATTPADRVDVQGRRLLSQAASNRPWRALDAVEDLARSDPAAAATALIRLLLRSEFPEEAAAVADRARAAGSESAELTEASAEAHVAAGKWTDALRDAEALRRRGGRDAAAKSLQARAYLGLDRIAEAETAADDALQAARGGRAHDRVPALVVKLRIAARAREIDRVRALYDQIRAIAPTFAEARDVAASAFLAAGRYADADALLSTVGAGATLRSDAAVVLAAVRLAQSDPRAARLALEATTSTAASVAEARTLLAATAGQAVEGAPRGSLAAFFAALATGGAAGDVAALARELDQPASLREMYGALAATLFRSAPEEARTAGRDFASARLYHMAPELGDRWLEELERVKPRFAGDDALFAALKAAWLLERDRVREAADLVVPKLEARPPRPGVRYLAAAAAAANGGAEAALRFLETLPEPPSDALVRDVARLLAARGEIDGAGKLFARIAAPTDVDRLHVLALAVERRDAAAAATAWAALPPARRSQPSARLASAWIKLQKAETAAQGAEELASILAEGRRTERL
ncbi:MAG TPA: tetratricopeptide repeat protein, partial [Planctomycetota bacterium]|nr:tetratricopeptide repeat protein [Planctomycetota bacterium]